MLWELGSGSPPEAFSRDPALSPTAPSQHFPCWLIPTCPALAWSPWLVSYAFWLPVLLFSVKSELGKQVFRGGFGSEMLRSSETFLPRGRKNAGPCLPALSFTFPVMSRYAFAGDGDVATFVRERTAWPIIPGASWARASRTGITRLAGEGRVTLPSARRRSIHVWLRFLRFCVFPEVGFVVAVVMIFDLFLWRSCLHRWLDARNQPSGKRRALEMGRKVLYYIQTLSWTTCVFANPVSQW